MKKVTTYERFVEILSEYNLTQEQIDRIWSTRPSNTLDESKLRYAAERTVEMLHATRQ